MIKMVKNRKKWVGYAKKVLGYGGAKYALFRNGKRVGTSSMVTAGGTDERHKAELRSRGYRIKKGYVRE